MAQTAMNIKNYETIAHFKRLADAPRLDRAEELRLLNEYARRHPHVSQVDPLQEGHKTHQKLLAEKAEVYRQRALKGARTASAVSLVLDSAANGTPLKRLAGRPHSEKTIAREIAKRAEENPFIAHLVLRDNTLYVQRKPKPVSVS